MSKVIFETIGNTIMFVLLALLFTQGLEVTILENGVEVSANVLVVIVVVYLLAYVVVLAIWNKKQGASFSHLISGPQMHKDTDEREMIVSLKAGRAAYLTTICTLPIAFIVFVAAHISGGSIAIGIDLFTVGCWLFMLSCIVINISYSAAWCIEERK